MVEINSLKARIFSKLGQSGAAFGVGLFEILKEHHEIVVLSSDMSRPAGLDRFKTMYPDMFYNVGIAEQNLIGIASGMASEGKKVIVTAQAAFISMRSFEQIRQYMGYMRSNIVAIGINSGFALNFFGNSHYAIEDIAIMRSIPGLTIISPSDAGQAVKAFAAAVNINTPVYIRLTGTLNCPIIYKDDYEFEIGKAKLIKDGKDITIFATGTMVYNSLLASDILEKGGISTRVIDMHTIKPLDNEILVKYSSSNLFVSVEEHNIIGGLGTAISEVCASDRTLPKLLRLGVRDTFSHPGEYSYLLEQNRLIPNLLAEDILVNYK
jgi:transketolase